jgi:erythromycin esterase
MAQEFYNLDFEYATPNAQPLKWSVEGYGGTFMVKVDSTHAKTGRKSLRITVDKAELYIFLILPPKAAEGKAVKIESNFRGLDIDSLDVRLILFNPSLQPEMSSAIKFNNSAWIREEHSHTFPSPYASDRMLTGIRVTGKGSFTMDDVKIMSDGVPLGNGPVDFREPVQKEVNALNEMAIPLNANLSFDKGDFAKVRQSLDHATVIGVGENSHGSGTIYKSKLELIKFLVQKMHYTVFALEAPVYTLDQINAYVLGAEGTLNDAVKNLIYKSWQVDEFAEIITWIREYNAHAKAKVKIFGIDMQSGKDELAYIVRFAEKYDSTLFQQLEPLQLKIQGASLTEQEWSDLHHKLEEAYKTIQSRSYASDKVVAAELIRIKRYMLVTLQNITMNMQSVQQKSRDQFMAENVQWISQYLAPGEKIIVSAENDHVTRLNGRMGFFLAQMFKENYLNIAYTFRTGTYSAYGDKPHYDVHEPHMGTYEYFLSKCKYSNYVIDLKQAKKIPLLNQKSGFRLIGSRPQEGLQFSEINIVEVFDMLIYLNQSKHSTPYRF